MDSEELIAKVGIYTASFVVGFVSGLLPFVNSELYLVAVSAIVARHSLLPIALLSALGQMVAKTILFYAGRGVFQINMGKFERKIEAVQKKFQEWENKADVLILISAAGGIPPFYVVSFVAGALKLHYLRFLAVGIVGRSIRFAVIIYFPQLILKYI
jgi:membrane protein YqaA with SNARE-associated domain